MHKRNIFQEIVEGMEALKAQRRGAGQSRACTERKMTRGSGKLFQDLGFTRSEADNLMLRARLLARLRDVARGETQRGAAKRFGITQPRLNEVLRGRIDKFSLDALVNMLAHAGMRVELRVKKAA